MVNLVFKTHNANVGAMYELATILNNRGFVLNPKARGFKMKYTRNIIVNLQEGIYTPVGLAVFDDPSKFYFIELKD